MNPIDKELSERLRRLRGESEPQSRGPDPILLQRSKTDEEQVESLLAQMSEVVKLEQIEEQNRKETTDQEIAQRLEKLKSETKTLSLNPFSSLDTKKVGFRDIVQEYTALAELERTAGFLSEDKDPDCGTSKGGANTHFDDLDMPWCVICNEDATIRCRGCDNDLYCVRCYMEFHDMDELIQHKTVPLKH